MSKPETIPFWEQSRGGGPITDWNNSRAEMHRRAAEREARYANPVAVLGDKRVKDGDGLSRDERRRRGLCWRCGARPIDGRAVCETHKDDKPRRRPRNRRQTAPGIAPAGPQMGPESTQETKTMADSCEVWQRNLGLCMAKLT